jgi:hypothetical protein
VKSVKFFSTKYVTNSDSFRFAAIGWISTRHKGERFPVAWSRTWLGAVRNAEAKVRSRGGFVFDVKRARECKQSSRP